MDSKHLHMCATLTLTTVYQTWTSISCKQPLVSSNVYDGRNVRREHYDGGGGGGGGGDSDDVCPAVRQISFN